MRRPPRYSCSCNEPRTEGTPGVSGFSYRLLREYPDTVPDVIHDAAQRPPGRQRSSIVDNSAEKSPADVNKLSRVAAMNPPSAKTRILPPAHAGSSVPDATTRSRSIVPRPKRPTRRSPVHVAAPAPMSKRTSPQSESSPRGLRIRSTQGRPGDGNKPNGHQQGDAMDTSSCAAHCSSEPRYLIGMTNHQPVDPQPRTSAFLERGKAFNAPGCARWRAGRCRWR
jgi:hypothetical protein